MRANLLLCLCAAMAMAGSAAAQKPARQSDKQPPAPVLPYKPVAITPPQPITDDSF